MANKKDTVNKKKWGANGLKFVPVDVSKIEFANKPKTKKGK